MAAPTAHKSRGYAVYLRGPAGVNTFGFATKEDYRAGVQHRGLMAVFPEPVDNEADDFGVMAGGGFSVEIADENDDRDWYLLLENGSRILLEDGSGALILEY